MEDPHFEHEIGIEVLVWAISRPKPNVEGGDRSEDRGSAKLGASADSLESALTAAKVSYKIERWWKYGQPAVDLIKGVINVTNVADAGKVVQELVSQQGKLQVSLEVFPYGIINPEGVRINVNLEQHPG